MIAPTTTGFAEALTMLRSRTLVIHGAWHC
jgi:hypothetical protein